MKKFVLLICAVLLALFMLGTAQAAATGGGGECEEYHEYTFLHDGGYDCEPECGSDYDCQPDCNEYPDADGCETTTTTAPGSTTTTTAPSTTTTTAPATTTTTAAPTTTTTAPATTTTTAPATTTTTAPIRSGLSPSTTSTTVDQANPCGNALSCNTSDDRAVAQPTPVSSLPRTGSTTGPLAAVGVGLLFIGAAILKLRQRFVI